MNYLTKAFISLIVAIIPATLMAHTKIVWLAILIGLIVSLIVAFEGLKISGKKEILYSISAAIIGSQIGWIALLI